MTGTVLATPTGLRTRTGRWAGAWGAGAALVLTGLVAALLLLAGGHDPVEAFRALLAGAAGSPDRILSATLVRAIPLILTGLAVALAFRAGVFNIGAEGQLYAGAVAGVAVGLLGGVPFLRRSTCRWCSWPRRWEGPSGRSSPPSCGSAWGWAR